MVGRSVSAMSGWWTGVDIDVDGGLLGRAMAERQYFQIDIYCTQCTARCNERRRALRGSLLKGLLHGAF